MKVRITINRGVTIETDGALTKLQESLAKKLQSEIKKTDFYANNESGSVTIEDGRIETEDLVTAGMVGVLRMIRLTDFFKSIHSNA